MTSNASGEWVDAPPASVSADQVWDDRLSELEDNPGKCKRWGPYAAASIARSVKNAVTRNEYERSDFDITTRSFPSETEGEKPDIYVYVTYVNAEALAALDQKAKSA